MINIISYIPIIVSLYLFWMAFAMHTNNQISAMLFQYIPFLLGLASLFTGAKLVGWI